MFRCFALTTSGGVREKSDRILLATGALIFMCSFFLFMRAMQRMTVFWFLFLAFFPYSKSSNPARESKERDS